MTNILHTSRTQAVLRVGRSGATNVVLGLDTQACSDLDVTNDPGPKSFSWIRFKMA